MSTVDPKFLASLRKATISTPELQSDSSEISERLQYHEASLISPGKAWHEIRLADYKDGSARIPDDIWQQEVPGTLVVASADHATDKFNRREGAHTRADHGTGALVMLLAEHALSSSVAPRGKQTWNVAVSDDTHPVKKAIQAMLPKRNGFLSVHGMYSGRVRRPNDSNEVHAVIGLGATPNEQSWEAAREVVREAKSFGLDVSIANEEGLLRYDLRTNTLATEADGTLERKYLRGSKPAMTNALAYRIMQEAQRPMVSMQLELSAFLRLRAMDDDGGWHADEHSRRIGTYLGFMLIKTAAEVAGRENL